MDYTIRRSARAKHMRIILKPTGELTLVLPRFVPEIAGRAFVVSQKKWIKNQTAKLPQPLKIYQQTDFLSGSELFLFDQKKYSINLVSHKNKRDYFLLDGEVLSLYLSIDDTVKKQQKIKRLIEKFYREQAAVYLLDRSAFWAQKLRASFNRVSIKNTKSRWGSCSSQKNLNYNWRIMLAPKEVVDYLVIHEVCHLKQMNHSAKFWNLVENLDPKFKEHKKYLKENQERLFNFLN